jgi:hypothetical protein
LPLKPRFEPNNEQKSGRQSAAAFLLATQPYYCGGRVLPLAGGVVLLGVLGKVLVLPGGQGEVTDALGLPVVVEGDPPVLEVVLEEDVPGPT